MPTLVIERGRTSFRDRGRKYKVLLDGQVVETLDESGEVIIPVAVGMHSFQVKLDFIHSREEKFLASEEENVRFKVEAKSPLGGLLLFFKPSAYFQVTRVNS